MKKTIKLNLDENLILTLNKLAQELHTSKTDIIERAIKLFTKTKKENNLLQYAGILKNQEADELLENIKDKKNKEFKL